MTPAIRRTRSSSPSGTPGTDDPERATEGTFTVHNPEIRGNQVFASWYSEGCFVIDILEPALLGNHGDHAKVSCTELTGRRHHLLDPASEELGTTLGRVVTQLLVGPATRCGL